MCSSTSARASSFPAKARSSWCAERRGPRFFASSLLASIVRSVVSSRTAKHECRPAGGSSASLGLVVVFVGAGPLAGGGAVRQGLHACGHHGRNPVDNSGTLMLLLPPPAVQSMFLVLLPLAISATRRLEAPYDHRHNLRRSTPNTSLQVVLIATNDAQENLRQETWVNTIRVLKLARLRSLGTLGIEGDLCHYCLSCCCCCCAVVLRLKKKSPFCTLQPGVSPVQHRNNCSRLPSSFFSHRPSDLPNSRPLFPPQCGLSASPRAPSTSSEGASCSTSHLSRISSPVRS